MRECTINTTLLARLVQQAVAIAQLHAWSAKYLAAVMNVLVVGVHAKDSATRLAEAQSSDLVPCNPELLDHVCGCI